MDRKLFGIVDPYSSGSLFATDLDKLGCSCIMVQSTPEIPELFRSSYRPGDYCEIVQHRGSADATAMQLKARGVSAIIAGCELGVELADRLSERLGLPSNGTALSAARRNKFLMAQRVAAHGLHIPRQFCSHLLKELMEWVRQFNSWPVIVKPVGSCASDRVCRCASEVEVETAYRSIMAHRNVLGEENTEVLVQEYLVGTEYVVDTVSCAGRHRAAGYWRYGKPTDSSFVCYDSMELLPYHGALQTHLFSFACGVLDALGVQYGPAHCELMWHNDSIAFVEMATRLTAGNNATLSRVCGATCQLDLTIDAYLDPTGFLKRMKKPQKLERWAANFFLMPREKGRLLAVPRMPEVQSLRSFHTASVGATMGEPAPRIAGLVTLIHADRDVIAEDIRTLRGLEDAGLYEIDEDISMQDHR